MSLIAQLQRLDRLDGLIRRKATGSSDQLAARLGCSRRTVYNLLKRCASWGLKSTTAQNADPTITNGEGIEFISSL